jgi:hypothetical protein
MEWWSNGLLRGAFAACSVIPSEVEGSRGSNLKARAAGSLDFARDDKMGLELPGEHRRFFLCLQKLQLMGTVQL